jgi:hypothetical protein
MSFRPGDDDADPDALTDEQRAELQGIDEDLHLLLQRKARIVGKAS